MDDLQRLMDAGAIGRRLALTVSRDGRTVTVHVTPTVLST
jgi:hypothetical protein